MNDIVQAKFDYAKLDLPKHRVRVRLDSICIGVRQTAKRVDLGYVRKGRLHRVTADHAVLACFNMIIPHLMPDLPEPQREALAKNVKAPLVYTNVAVRNWEAWTKLGVHEISAPMSFHCRLKLDYPVDLGGYRHPRKPTDPMCLHLVHVPGEPNEGHDARDQFRLGRQKLLDMSFEQFEAHIRADLDRMLGPGGFSSARDIAAITVNRWSHGYAYSANSLFDGDDADATMELARQPAGRVTIANSDSQWSAYAHSAIDAAERAVRELRKS
jgi:spermidine dehydrogenase